MIRAIPIRILRKILLVIVGAEAISYTEITDLSCRDQSIGRVSVDVALDSPVDGHLFPATGNDCEGGLHLLLVVVGSEEGKLTESAGLCGADVGIGRDSADVDVKPSVDLPLQLPAVSLLHQVLRPGRPATAHL